MFQFDDSWEQEEGREVLRELFNMPGLRRHQFVEVVANPHLIHVDAIFDDDDKSLELWQRFMATDFGDAVNFLKDNPLLKCRISIQNRHHPEEDYRISTVTKIFGCLDEANLAYYICETAGGEKIYSHPRQSKTGTSDRCVEIWKL